MSCESMKYLAANLTYQMKEMNMNQTEFATYIGISQAFLSKILKNNQQVCMDTLDNIATKLNTTSAALISKPAAKVYRAQKFKKRRQSRSSA